MVPDLTILTESSSGKQTRQYGTFIDRSNNNSINKGRGRYLRLFRRKRLKLLSQTHRAIYRSAAALIRLSTVVQLLCEGHGENSHMHITSHMHYAIVQCATITTVRYTCSTATVRMRRDRGHSTNMGRTHLQSRGRITAEKLLILFCHVLQAWYTTKRLVLYTPILYFHAESRLQHR